MSAIEEAFMSNLLADGARERRYPDFAGSGDRFDAVSAQWRFDFAWPAERVAVEIEGVHGGGGRHQRVDGVSQATARNTRRNSP